MLSNHLGLRACAVSAAVAVILMGGAGAASAAPSDKGAERQAAAAAQKSDHGSVNNHHDSATATGGGSARAGNGLDHTDGNASTVGDVDGPQPESGADRNDGGANSYDCDNGPEGPYCGTDRTEPSANGKGGGAATGRPGAGTVGKADNKNPPGQEPGPSDGNAGYECDRNQGIAKGNPAHTACKEPTGGNGGNGGNGDDVLGVEDTAPPALPRPPAAAPAAAALPQTGAPQVAPAVLTSLVLLTLGAWLLLRRRTHPVR